MKRSTSTRPGRSCRCGSPVVLLLLAAVSMVAGIVSVAAVAEAQAEDAGNVEEQAKEHFAQGNKMFFAGKYPEAGLEYRKTLELMPGLANPHKNLARCYLAMKQENMYPDAAFHLLRYQQLKPQDDDKKVQTDLRQVITALKLPGVAGREKDEVTKLLEEQGTAAAEEEKWTVAVLRFEQLRDLHPQRSDLLKLLAESYLGAYRCDQARRTYQAYLLVHPEEHEVLNVDSMIAECDDEARQRGQEGGPPGKLVVIANVTGAVLLIDGKKIGNTPLDGPLRLSSGDHQLALFKEGYETLSQKVTVSPGATTQVKLTLMRFQMPDEPAAGGGEPPSAGSGASGAGIGFALLPRAGVMTALGGSGGTALGPSAGLVAALELSERLALLLDVGFHLYAREFSESPPFTHGEVGSTVVRLLAGGGYRQPLGQKLRLLGGLALGIALAANTVRDDAGQEENVQSSVLCLQLHAGTEYALGPGGLQLTTSYLAQLQNDVSISYGNEELLPDLQLGGLGLHLGYRYAF